MRHASVFVRRALARAARDQRRAVARVDAFRRSTLLPHVQHAAPSARTGRGHDLARRTRFRLPPFRLPAHRPVVAALTSDRRVAPVLVLLLVLVTLLVGAVPATSAAIGDTEGTGQPGYPAIAGLRGQAAEDPAAAAVDTTVDPADVGVSDVVDGPAAAADGATELAPTGDYALDGTLVKPLSADTIQTNFQMQVYVVKAGDTLSGVAIKFGLSTMTIWWANTLTSKDQLHVGQRLLIPPVDGVVYTVKEGDTLDALATKFRSDPQTIMAYNALETEELALGQQLMIPDGVGAAIAVAPAPKTTTSTTNRSSSGSSSRTSSGCTSCNFSGRMTWPVPGGYISQGYHYGHWALDIANDYGSPIVAAAAGKVTFSGWRNNGGGYQVWISHGNNLYTTYNHMSSVAVYAGQSVGRGQFIGRVGQSGNATGPHCHFEVWIGPIWAGGRRVNPLNYF
ncbi:MAG: peptidoglycan DD-metalloendopeptidase family protein [Candidatus Limnocylindrales bacterium]